MSKKDFDREFAQIEKQYLEMIGDLKDMQQEFADGLVSPDTLEQMKKIVEPIVVNYNMWNYVRFLLNKPNKKEKEAKYIRQTKKLQENMKTFNDVIEENNQVLSELKEFTDE